MRGVLFSDVLGTVRRHGIWLTALLTVAVFFGLLLVGDATAIATALLTVDPWRVVAVVVLATLSYCIRFLKWDYYLRVLAVDVPLWTSLVVFFSGLMMVVTPGKAGEVWKAWFLRDMRDVPVTRTAPVVGAERVTDLIALSAFAFLGLVLYRQSSLVLVGVVAIFALGVGLLQWRTFCLHVLSWIKGLPVIGAYATTLERFYESTYTLFQLRPLCISTLVSLIAWGLEGAALWIVMDGFTTEFGFLAALFVFGLGSVVGAASLLPGGLAATEASMVGMLVVLGHSETLAVSATLIVRAGTLWYGAILGLCIFVAYRLIRDRNRITPLDS